MVLKKVGKTHRIRLHVGIASIFLVIVVALTAGIIWNNYRQASSAAVRTADQLFHEITTKVDERMNGMLVAVKTTIDTASAMPSLSRPPHYDGLSHTALESMIRMIESLSHVFAVFVGYSSGDWIQVSAPRGDPIVSEAFNIPNDTHFLVRVISRNRDGKRLEYLRYLDRSRHVIGARTNADPSYDPRKRDWYNSALAAERTLFSNPFVFFALKKPGITVSRRLIGGGGVVSVGVTLSNFSKFLSDQTASPNAIAFLFNSKGEILAHQDPSLAAPLGQKDEAEKSRGGALRRANEIGNPIAESLVREVSILNADISDLKRVYLNGRTYLVRVEPVGQRMGVDQYMAIVAPLSDFTQHIARMQRQSIVTSLVALAIALPLVFLIARRVAAKLGALATEADKIRQFDLESPVTVESHFVEVHNLAHAFGSMKQAVGVFGQYVPKALVQEIVQSGTTPKLGGQRQEITVLFTDVADFTGIAEGTEPEDLMLRTSEYFEALGAVLSQHHGVVDKYIGDAIMALWNAPSRDDDHVVHACAAVLACREVSRDLAKVWTKQAIQPFGTRFGLHCGEAVVGNVGGADRINFTAVGATINLASRLEALNKLYGTEILISEDVVERVGRQFLTRPIDRVQPVGVTAPVNIYELMAARSGLTERTELLEASEKQVELCALWNHAYETYVARDWQRALGAFEAVLSTFPQDGPASTFVGRCRDFIDIPPDPSWDGVTLLSRK
jgi:adenylate cyclase